MTRIVAARIPVLIAAVMAAVLVAGCDNDQEPSSGSIAPADPAVDLLARVLERGTLVLSTDTEYPPQSYLVEGAERPVDTRCAVGQLTGAEVAGYDADTGKLVAEALGVEPCFVVPTWTEITAGNWGDRWDIAFGSGSMNADRMTRLWMTQPYYSVPNHYFVRADSEFQVAADLSGKQIGACASCSHEAYLRGELEIPGVEIDLEVVDPVIVTYQAEPPGLEAVSAGDIDAFLAAAPVGRQAIDAGAPLRAIEPAAFVYYPSGFVDKGSGLETGPFIARVSEIVQGLHADGSLAALSERTFGEDYATVAGQFDMAALDQDLP